DGVGQHVGANLFGGFPPLRGDLGRTASFGQGRPGLRGQVAGYLRRGEVLRGRAHLPDPAVRLPPALQRAFHLRVDDVPQPVADAAGSHAVQVDRADHGAPHVVLALVVGAVA